MKTSSKEEENFDIVFGEKACNDLSDKLDQFKLIYEEAFPKKEEREDFDAKIRERLKAGDKPQNENHPQTIAYLMYTDSQKQRMVGGLIGDWYPKVGMMELIYMVVAKGLRRNDSISSSERPHYGRTLLRKGAEALCIHFGQKPKNVSIFFEAENPFDPANAKDYEQTVGRFRFFSQSGGYRLPIEYVQPPLEINGEYARNLCLFVLSLEEGKDSKKSIPYKKLQKFIDAFYDGLKDNIDATKTRKVVEFESERNKLKRNIQDVADSEDNVPFDPIGEEAHMHFSKVAVSTHFEIQDRWFIPKKIKKEEGKICPDWGSYESDLFNYHNQDPKPFTTHLATSTPIENVTLPLPRIYQYTSEGRCYCKLSQRDSIQVDVSVSWSMKRNGKKAVRIAHLALIPHQDEESQAFFTELELIKIIAGLGFGSKQEQFTLLEKDRSKFEKFFTDILQEALNCKKFKALKTGITEINKKKGISNHGTVGNWITYRRNVLCGILLGIFDFTRMSPVEADVTLRPIVEFPKVGMHYYASRGHLLRIMERKKDEEENLQNLLISPYLVIPSAALCYNEILLKDKANLLSRKGFRWSRIRGVSPVKRALSADFLTDIFQYESEKHLLNRIMVGRSQLQERSRLLEKSRLRQTKTAHFLEAMQATILAAIAVFQLRRYMDSCPTLFWWIFAGVVGTFLFYSIYRLCQ